MFGNLFGNKYKPKVACRVRISKHPKFWVEPLLISRKKAYLDVKLYRNNNEVSHIIFEDTGFSCFTIIGLGTFLIPDEGDKKTYLRKGQKIYLNYDITSSKPYEPIKDLSPMGFRMPKIAPHEYVNLLETQSMADVCAEDVKDTNWLLIIAILAIGMIILFMFTG